MSELRSRWYHRPILHTPQVGVERKAGWLELFYDLIYVAGIIQLGNALSDDVSATGFFAFVGIFVPIWLAWTSYTFFSNRFLIDDFLHRALTFLQMFGVGAMAICVPDVLKGDPIPFVIAYAFVRAVFVLFYLRAYIQVPEARALSRRWGLLSLADAALWTVSIFVGWPWMYLFWLIGVLCQISIPAMPRSRDLALRYPPDVLHMTERYGLLTIIVLGESFVKVLSSLYEHGLDPNTMAMGGLALLITCGMWWIYFDDIGGSRLKQKRGAPFIWVYTHLPLTIGITGTGVAIKKALYFAPFEPAPDKYRWLLAGMLGLALLAVSLIDFVTERRQAELSDRTRVNVRIGSAVFILLLAPAGGVLPAWLFVSLCTAVILAQVVFDLMMAPLETDAEMALHDAQAAIPVAPRTPTAQQTEAPATKRRYLTGDRPVIKGAPNELRRDLYFFFMEGSWLRFFAVVGTVFIFVNFVFGALFLLDSSSVANIRPGNIWDAFFFSVQTMATIGYGVMAPTSAYGHTLVTLEAIVGLLGTALVTGLMFAKAARPTASVLFSRHAVISTHEDERTLMFRIGNARGHEIVDATVNVSVLIDEISPEGHKFRKLHDLALRRNRTPLFAMSWTVIHTIDADSPLAEMDWTNLPEQFFAMVVTLTGHDSTYAQTVYGRHIYQPEDIYLNYRMIDVIEDLSDGRLMVDYTKFHDIEPDPTTSG